MNHDDQDREVGKKAKPKSKHGSGLTFSMEFFSDDADEMKALDVSRRLAKHGHRKQYVVAVFAALYNYADQYGRLPSITQVVTALEKIDR